MNLKRQFTTFALASILLLAGCKKDDYVAVVGVCPIITATNPLNTATGVALNQVVTATFNEKMNPASITQSSFTLQGATKIAGNLVYDDATATIRFTPTALLTANTTYTGTVSYGVKDDALIEVGSMGVLKSAEIVLFKGTPVALFAGSVEITVGDEADMVVNIQV